jgi:hypothetical protein
MDQTNPCLVCGPHRYISFAPFAISPETASAAGVHHIVSDKPVHDFLDWILYKGLNKRYVAFAHNAGRFDLQLIVEELVKFEIYPAPKPVRQGNRFITLKVDGHKETPQNGIKRQPQLHSHGTGILSQDVQHCR